MMGFPQMVHLRCCVIRAVPDLVALGDGSLHIARAAFTTGLGLLSGSIGVQAANHDHFSATSTGHVEELAIIQSRRDYEIFADFFG